MQIIVISIFYFTISTIVPTIILFKRKKDNKDTNKIKALSLYLLSIMLHTILLLVSFYISIHKYTNLGNCGLMCYKYTNTNFKILVALTINLISNIIFYIITKNILLKLINSKLKYIIISTYILFEYCALIFGMLTFYGFSGIYIVKNPILNILRFIITYLPLIIYPIDIIVLDKMRKKISKR